MYSKESTPKGYGWCRRRVTSYVYGGQSSCPESKSRLRWMSQCNFAKRYWYLLGGLSPRLPKLHEKEVCVRVQVRNRFGVQVKVEVTVTIRCQGYGYV